MLQVRNISSYKINSFARSLKKTTTKWCNVNFQKVKDTGISKYHMYILNICNFSQLYLNKAGVGGVGNQYVNAKN